MIKPSTLEKIALKGLTITPERYREIREVLGMDQGTFARNLGISRESVNRRENNRQPIDSEAVLALAGLIYRTQQAGKEVAA